MSLKDTTFYKKLKADNWEEWEQNTLNLLNTRHLCKYTEVNYGLAIVGVTGHVQTPQPASQTPGPEGYLHCLHWGLNSRVPLPVRWPTVTQVHLLPLSDTPWMYGRNMFQILQKKGIPTKAEFKYGTNEHPSAEVYQLAQGKKLSGLSRIHTID